MGMFDEPNISLQMNNNLERTVIIHKISGSGTFDGKYLSIYEDI
jgi:hypothetical protein